MFRTSPALWQHCPTTPAKDSCHKTNFPTLETRLRSGKSLSSIKPVVQQPYGFQTRREALCNPKLPMAMKGDAEIVSSEPSKLSILSNKRVVRAIACASLVLAIKLALPAAVFAAEQVVGGSGLLTPFKGIVDFILHLDDKLGAIIAEHGTATYAILFAIVFCETGLVLTPFLPGDSLLFAAGAFAGLKKLNIYYVLATFISSAILGDAVNYSIGAWLGEKAIDSGVVSKKAITKTEKFYDKYGGKTIVLARFVPIVRTFAPFVAGISKMAYQKFATYNVFGAIVWTLLFTGVGFFFGNLPFVEKNFSLVVLAIVAVSVLPVIFEVIAARKEEAESGDKGSPAAA